jgi:hypothetical protein
MKQHRLDATLFRFEKHWDTPSRHCHDNPVMKWAIEQAESMADNGRVNLTYGDNWWKLTCRVAGATFSVTCSSPRKCVQALFSFATRGCQYVEIARPLDKKAKQQRML